MTKPKEERVAGAGASAGAGEKEVEGKVEDVVDEALSSTCSSVGGKWVDKVGPISVRVRSL